MIKLDQETFNRLVDLFNKDQNYELEKNLKFLLERYPKSYSLLNLQGVFEKKIGNLNQSISSLKKAIKVMITTLM